MSASAQRALDLGEVGASSELLAVMSVAEGDYKGAERLLARAVEAVPEISGVRAVYSFVLNETGRPGEALTHARKAVDLDPLFADRHDSLGSVYLSVGDYDEAIQTIRDAMAVHKSSDDDVGLELRYFLLTSLQKKADQDRDLDSAVEADKIASAIAIQQISYKDVRARRDEIKKLISALRDNPAA